METVTFVDEPSIRSNIARAYAEHAARLRHVLPHAELLHIGSSSVPHTLTKGDLDILVRVVAPDHAAAARALGTIATIHQPENWGSTYASFTATDPIVDVGYQLVTRDSDDDRSMTSFPALLRARPDVLARYEAIKRAFEGRSMDEYRAAKSPLIWEAQDTSFAPRMGPPAQVLVDDGLVLQLLDPDAADDLAAAVAAGGTHLTRWLPHLAEVVDHASAREFIRTRLLWFGDGSSAEWGVIEHGRLVGKAWIADIQHHNDAADIGYWLVPDACGRGIATRVTERLLRVAFEELQLHRISIRCIADNVASRAIPERLGFKLEGTIRGAWKVNDRHVDHVIYGLLTTEWQLGASETTKGRRPDPDDAPSRDRSAT